MTAKITSKGQITIPLPIRKHLRLKPGDVLDFDEKAPFLKARRAIDEAKARAVSRLRPGADEREDGQAMARLDPWAGGFATCHSPSIAPPFGRS